MGTGDATTNYLDSGGATNVPARYYRIRLVPQLRQLIGWGRLGNKF